MYLVYYALCLLGSVTNIRDKQQMLFSCADFTDGPSTPDVPDQLEEKQEKTDELTPIESQAGSNRLKIHSRRFREYESFFH